MAVCIWMHGFKPRLANMPKAKVIFLPVKWLSSQTPCAMRFALCPTLREALRGTGLSRTNKE
jgi:hypothetical protein